MTPATRKAHLDKLLAWCKANADKTEEDLLMDALRDAAGDREALAAGAGLAHLKSHKGTALLVGRMATMDDTWKGDLAEICYRLDDPATLDAARKWANAPQAGVKFWAAMILLKHGDKAKIEGLATLQVAVQGEGGTEFYPEALDVLLASGNEEASKLADGILETKDFRVEPWYPHGQIIKLLFLAGHEACLKKMTAALASADVETARRAADVVAEWRKDKWSVDASAPADQQKAKFQEAAQWLQEQLALILRREAPGHGHGQTFATPLALADRRAVGGSSPLGRTSVLAACSRLGRRAATWDTRMLWKRGPYGQSAVLDASGRVDGYADNAGAGVPPNGDVELLLRGPDAKPAAQVEVHLTASDKIPFTDVLPDVTTTTDTLGVAHFVWPGGVYQMKVRVKGMGYGVSGLVEVIPGKTAQVPLAPLAPFAHLTGTLPAGMGQGVTVSAYGSPSGDTVATTPDAAGHFELEGPGRAGGSSASVAVGASWMPPRPSTRDRANW